MSKLTKHLKNANKYGHPRDARTNARVRAQRRGRWAEWLARLSLIVTGHRILAANYKTPVGEVDLIAAKRGTVSFVEVKARASAQAAIEAVGPRQRLRIQRAAEHFLTQHPHLQTRQVRFDVALVSGPLRVRLLPDAWRPER